MAKSCQTTINNKLLLRPNVDGWYIVSGNPVQLLESSYIEAPAQHRFNIDLLPD